MGRTGIADKVLADKEREREKRRRSESVSTYSSGSDSASTYSSSDEEGGERKRVRRDSRSGSSASYSSGRSQSRSQSPEQRGRSKSVDLRDGGVTRDVDSPERRPVAKSPESSRPRRRSSSPRVPTEPARARSRWDQRGPSPRRERSLSPYSRRQQLSRR